MDRIVGANGHFTDAVGDPYAWQRARKRLLVFVRMGKFPSAENGAVRSNDLPCVGIVVPTFIGMTDRHIEPIRAGPFLDDLDANHIRFTGKRVSRHQCNRQGQGKGARDVVTFDNQNGLQIRPRSPKERQSSISRWREKTIVGE